MDEKYLSPKDAAEILSVKKTTVYDMIRTGRLKAVKIGKQFRIREGDVLALVTGSTDRETKNLLPYSAEQEEDGSILLCGQDLLLDHLCAHVNAKMGFQAVRRAYLGSYNSIYAAYQGQANLATAHLWDWETDSYNLPFVTKMLPGMEVRVYHIVNRLVGIYVAKGNPKGIHTIIDFARGDVRMVNREKGSGIRVLTDSLFLQNKIVPAMLRGYETVAPSHAAVAAAVAQGRADCAFGNARSVLGSKTVDFVPVKYEQYDLIVPAAELEKSIVQCVIETLCSDVLRMETAALGAYDVKDMGKRLL